ncbi:MULTISPECIES: SMI1/KNR4 family protein [unclassified Lentimonas]|uniref:SMI1/KNR4 family protein n=1 Tax=unclassified Lentimonas TaxID=2630993 RepID=UPI001325844E|nr:MULTISPECIES: SMI1/KNR4 family protein [unclassified Lentimonas]CAA6696725.1 Unannotated [Lentimonas sp. CC10]CAA6697339.1 Unannotated [Lentimonas sp. CC19]CAA7072248.1 Unannotated [Lentimonas sp. CC11]
MKEDIKLWGFELPTRFFELHKKGSFDSIRIEGQQEISLPFPLLRTEEIKNQESLKDDWEIPVGLLPFMGDMHDLVCLDYSESNSPSVVLIDDSRMKIKITDNFEDFYNNVYLAPEAKIDSSGVIEGETWLDF